MTLSEVIGTFVRLVIIGALTISGIVFLCILFLCWGGDKKTKT